MPCDVTTGIFTLLGVIMGMIAMYVLTIEDRRG